jgi:hypothetical protein
VPDLAETVAVPPGGRKELDLANLRVQPGVKSGRHVIEVRTRDASGTEGCDCFFAVDVVSP